MKAHLRPRRYTFSFITVLLVALVALLGIRLRAHGQRDKYASAPRAGDSGKPVYDWRKGKYPAGAIRGEALDEARAGMTLNGTPVSVRTAECFPAEPRDVFWKMDWVPSGPNGELQPLNFDENGDGKVDDSERDAIRGRNTWLLWGGGNEAFWAWLQEKGYGLTDFLILMDSRRRANRFKEAGLINQPGFEISTEPILGLYIDAAKKDGSATLLPPQGPNQNSEVAKTGYSYSYNDAPKAELYDAQGRKLANPVYRPTPPPGHPTELFKPWTTAKERAEEWEKEKKPGEDPYKDYVPEAVRKRLPQDGLDPTVYGYPSGVFGLRLMLNPDFFGKTKDAEKARSYWKQRVEGTNGQYYTNTEIHADPKLIRPFRISMSCGFCHVAPHPLNPPKNVEEPKWENLSGIIGGQYWDPRPAFGNLLRRPNFLYHFLKSQAPGTIDTSLVSTDHINNTNVINPIFDVPARLKRAMVKPTEEQSRVNLLLPSLEDPETSNNSDGVIKQRHFPMVLGPGEDSVGVFGALARVPLNIGVFSEQWARCDNPVLGYTPQRPFRIEVGRANSVYWNVNEKYRVGYMAKFFTLGTAGNVLKSTAPMKLKDAGPNDESGRPLGVRPDGKVRTLGQAELEKDTPERRLEGRKVFLNNCAICHSSKQPVGFDLRFQREMAGGWGKAPIPVEPSRLVYTLPMDYRDWNAFKKSPSYRDYLQEIGHVAGEAPSGDREDPFVKDNFLSNELRIPITLVGTYAGRALATNAMRGNVWDNYSSETFKRLPSVGKIRFFNPYKPNASAVKFDPFGTNDEFDDGRKFGGPGYFRPATLISVWATAPYFHNNALGLYNQDPSVKGRLVAFNDGIRKLLWPKQRALYTRDGVTYVPPGDLRAEGSAAARDDPGYIYRLPVDTYVMFQPGFTPLLIKGLLVGYVGITPGKILFGILSFWVWLILTIIFTVTIFYGRARHAGVFLLLLAVALGALRALTGAGGYAGMLSGVLMMGATNLLGYAGAWLWLIVIVITATGFLLLLTRYELKWLTKFIFIVTTIVTLVIGILANKFLNGELKDVPLPLAILPNGWLNANYKGIQVGPIPRGTPVNLLMNLDPAKRDRVGPALIALLRASAQIQKQHLVGEEAYAVIAKQAGPKLIAASKCPDFVLDRGHYFGDVLEEDPTKNDEAKEALIAFLKTL
jgi:hypothetical protein